MERAVSVAGNAICQNASCREYRDRDYAKDEPGVVVRLLSLGLDLLHRGGKVGIELSRVHERAT